MAEMTHALEVRTVSQLLGEVRSVFGHDSSRNFLFRGQGETRWPLVPTIARVTRVGDRTMRFDPSSELNLIRDFRRLAYPHRRAVIGDWEALFVGRHHGLPVRLLDWTTNPLVAAYWACQAPLTAHGAVWIIEVRPVDQNGFDALDPASRSPFAIPGIRVVYPFHATPRITAQAAVFTIQDDPWTPLEQLALEADRASSSDIVGVSRWLIPRSAKGPILDDLAMAGLSHMSLFPDLDGVASGLVEAYAQRSGTPDVSRKHVRTK